MAHVRIAKPAEFNELADVAHQAFISDPVFNFFGRETKMLDMKLESDAKACKDRRAMLQFLIKACHLAGGRVTVAVEPTDDSKGEKLLAGCLWLPPRKRLAPWQVRTLLRAGVLPVLRGWGLGCLVRITLNYQEPCEKKWHEYLKSDRSNLSKQSAEDSWYLQLAFTSPDHQGRGLMSLLIREAFSNAPEALFTLEATSTKSRDQYAHIGFGRPVSIKVGQGKTDARGIIASKTDAVGIECWLMTKWPSDAEQAKDAGNADPLPDTSKR